jgi:hypothetical protein
MAAAAEEALKSNYRYNMIFNNTSTNNDDDDVKFNTNLISDFDLQNFDPKRYEYYVNLLKVFNNDPDTLSKLLNKYNSIKTLKVKERKIIREISDYVNKLRDIEGNDRTAAQAGGGDNSELKGKKAKAQKLYDSVEKLYNDADATVASEASEASEASDAFKAAIETFKSAILIFKDELKPEQILDNYSLNVDIINVFQESVDTFKIEIENYNSSKQNGGVLLKDLLIAKGANIGAVAETDAGAGATGAATGVATVATGAKTAKAATAAAKKKNDLIKEANRLAGEATKLIKNTQDANRNMKEKIDGDKSGISELLKVLEEGKIKDDKEKAKEKERKKREKKREDEEKLLAEEREKLKGKAARNTNTQMRTDDNNNYRRRPLTEANLQETSLETPNMHFQSAFLGDDADNDIIEMLDDAKIKEGNKLLAEAADAKVYEDERNGSFGSSGNFERVGNFESFRSDKSDGRDERNERQPTRQASSILQATKRSIGLGDLQKTPPFELQAGLQEDRQNDNKDRSMIRDLKNKETEQISLDKAAEEKARLANQEMLANERLELKNALKQLKRQQQGTNVVSRGLIDNLEETLAIAKSKKRTLKAPPTPAPIPALAPPTPTPTPAPLVPAMSAAAPVAAVYGGAADEYNDDTLKARYLEARPQRYSRITLDDPKIEKLRAANKENRESGSEDTGAVKTDNKIEQLSNDIDVYNGLSSAEKDNPIKNNEMIQKIKRFEDDPKNPLEELELTFDDRIVFIIATFFIRYITIIMVQWCIDINIIKTFYEGFIYYAVIYIILFWFIVLFINIDNSFDVKYMNFNGIINSIRTLFYYFYMGTNGISRLLIHTSLILLLIVIPIILNIKKNTDFKPEDGDGSGSSNGVKILDFEERKQLSKALSLFTMFIWLFTSIIATKF